jgi:hypothetical protein
MPVPARITLALDAIAAEGPDVDIACGTWEGNPAGDVDAWELGESFPTPAQVELLAAYTGMTPEYFYLTPEPAEESGIRLFMCARNRRSHNALTVVESRIGWDGVLEVNELVAPRSPYRPWKPTQQPAAATQVTPADPTAQDLRKPHKPVENPDVPGCCRCRRPMDCATRMHTTARRSP